MSVIKQVARARGGMHTCVLLAALINTKSSLSLVTLNINISFSHQNGFARVVYLSTRKVDLKIKTTTTKNFCLGGRQIGKCKKQQFFCYMCRVSVLQKALVKI